MRNGDNRISIVREKNLYYDAPIIILHKVNLKKVPYYNQFHIMTFVTTIHQ